MSSIALYLRTLLEDGRYSMLRQREIVQHGYEEFADSFRNTTSPRSLLFCVPEHCNIGDHAIAYAERRFLAESNRPLLEFGGNMTKTLRCIRHAGQES